MGSENSGLASKYTSNATISDWSKGGQLWAKKSTAFSKLKSRKNALKKKIRGGDRVPPITFLKKKLLLS